MAASACGCQSSGSRVGILNSLDRRLRSDGLDQSLEESPRTEVVAGDLFADPHPDQLAERDPIREARKRDGPGRVSGRCPIVDRH